MREMGNKGKPEPVIDAAIYPFADALPPARPMLESARIGSACPQGRPDPYGIGAKLTIKARFLGETA